ncbi:hypothetical protein A3Q56_01095 [Intoshia linei]|uniref:Amidase domain-containing protein n=1 Tax=Intoshia linei TaxID=1819745 RepID=A0A177BA04_9BILA|nr:hypothetical protein A3Q56_01095 [Intoshia linei]
MPTGILHTFACHISNCLRDFLIKSSLWDNKLYDCKDVIERIKNANQYLDYVKKIINKDDYNCIVNLKSDHDIMRNYNQVIYNADKRNLRLKCVPFMVKDNYCTRDIKTTCCSKLLAEYQPDFNATLVKSLQDEGAILIAKTNMDEFSMGSTSTSGIYGPVTNPYSDAEGILSAGGSSGGSSAAVAANLVPFSLGSDTGGSVRNPASMCGVYGFKPTYGRFSRYGIIPMANSYDTPGFFVNSPQDLLLLMDILSGHDKNDSTSVDVTYKEQSLSINDFKIGILDKNYLNFTISNTVNTQFNFFVDNLKNIGFKHFKNIQLSTSMKYGYECYNVTVMSEIASNMSRFNGVLFGDRKFNQYDSAIHETASTRSEYLGNTVKERILSGNFYLQEQNYKDVYLKACSIRQSIINEIQNIFKDVDVIVSPTLPSNVPKIDDMKKISEDDKNIQMGVFTILANIAGLPAISIPQNSHSCPIGIQIMAPKFKENYLISISNLIQDSS